MQKTITRFLLYLLLFCTIKNNASIQCIISSSCTEPNALQRAYEIIVQTHFGAGFYAELGKVVSALIHFEGQDVARFFVDWTNTAFPYKDQLTENAWDLFFEPIIIDPSKEVTEVDRLERGFHAIHGQHCTDQWVLYDRYLPYRIKVHDIIQKYIRIKKTIIEQVDRFYTHHMQDFYCIGVHVRFAQDHDHELPSDIIPLKCYFDELDLVLAKAPIDRIKKIYVATDSYYVLEQFKQRYNTMVIHLNAARAEYNEEPHKPPHKPGYKGGVEALMESLLLARCNCFIHSVSNVASFVVYFNPYIKSVFLPKKVPLSPCGYLTDLVLPDHNL